MSKKYKITGSKTDNIGNDNNGSNDLNMYGNTINNSVTKNKYLSKGKNAKKKQVDKIEIRNKNLLPPQEEPSYENGKFACKLDELYSSALLNPEINDISFLRLCGENNIDMGYVLNNYIKSIYKRYKLRDVRASINSAQMLNEIKNAIINVASRI